MPENDAGACGWLLGAWMGMLRLGASARAGWSCAPRPSAIIPPHMVAHSSIPRGSRREATLGRNGNGARGRGWGRDINRPLDEEVA
ncbi:hypothetical protein JCM25156A_05530 [Komagataeibacter kakiaceti JCM 25156]